MESNGVVMENNLEREFEYYIKNQDRLVSKYRGRYIVIKDESVIDDYDTEIEAIEETARRHEMGTFMVQKCEPGEENYTHTFHSRGAVHPHTRREHGLLDSDRFRLTGSSPHTQGTYSSMKIQTKAFLGGVGSIMDIMPAPSFEQYVSEKSLSERIRGHWARVGQHIRKSIEWLDEEQSEEK